MRVLFGALAVAVAFGGQAVAQTMAASAVPVSGLPGNISHRTDEMRRTHMWSTALALSVDGSRYNPAGLAKLTGWIVDLGTAEDDARQGIDAFIARGLKQEDVTRLSLAAKMVAIAKGWDFPYASQTIARGVTAGYPALAALDDELNFLTSTQRVDVRLAFDRGEAESAREISIAALQARAATVAKAIMTQPTKKNPAG